MKKITLLFTIVLCSLTGKAQNNSLNFDGADDYVSLANNFAFENTDQFSVEAWVNVSTVTGLQQIISKLDINFRGWGFQIMDSGVLSGYLFSTLFINQRYVEGTTNLVDGQWHHVAMTFDGEDIVLYVDGILEPLSIEDKLGTLETVDNVGETHIGNYDAEGVSGEFMIGNIDELRIWEGVRTVTQIVDNYQTELDGTEANLIGYYKMDENDSQCDVVDCSPTGAHGERIGASGVNNLPQFSTNVPTITDVDCDETQGCSLSVNELDSLSLKIYPNPTVDKISIVGLQEPVQKIDVFDISGKRVSVESLEENKLSLEKLGSGVYFLVLQVNNQRITHKLIKQ